MPDPTYVTARLAMLLYAAALFTRLFTRRPTNSVRLFYTAGCVLLLAHIAIAFHVHHHWSHAAARAHVAEMTKEYTGVASGVGLWLNYLAAAAWTADVTIWWIGGTGRYARRPRWVSASVHAFLIFMAFNAAVAFAKSPSRNAASAVTAVLIVAAGTSIRRTGEPDPVGLRGARGIQRRNA